MNNATPPASIAIILPPREGFGPAHFGAVALCVKEFVEFSRYRNACTVYGGVDTPPFEGFAYHYAKPRGLLPFGSQSAAYKSALLKAFKANPPKLVEVHNRPQLLRELAAKVKAPLTLHLHNDPQEMKGAETPKERQWLIGRCAAIYCVSEYIRKRFLEGVTDPDGTVTVVYNGIALPNPRSMPKKPQILFVGRMKPEKGALEFAQAIAQVMPGYKSWKAILVGAERHEPNAKLSDYERKVKEALSPLGERAEMRGFLPYAETMRLYAESEVAIIPSLWPEPFGRTALEAMANSCAVISSTRGGLREVVGEAALTIKDITADKIAEQLRILMGNPLLRQEYGDRAAIQARTFDIRQTIQALDNVREKLLGK